MAMSLPIRLVAGLGNPGRAYASTRHNAGFWYAEMLGNSLHASFAPEAKFEGEIAKAGNVRLAKPSTFMNLSGRCVASLARFYDIAPEEILVVHDELDLRPGEVKMKFGGGHAGHNGLRDIEATMGSASFWRLRVGIGHPRDSAIPQQEVVDYVLKPFSAARLATSVARLRERVGGVPAPIDGLLEVLEASASPAKEYLRWITASQGDDLRLITVDEICYIRADNKYTVIATPHQDSLIRRPIKELIEELDPRVFWQIHRGTLVNVNAIAGVTRNLGGQLCVKLKQRKEALPVSESYVHLFKQM